MTAVGRASLVIAGATALAALAPTQARAQRACPADDVWCARDADHDEVVDTIDACDDQPEDLDQHEDLDGCPDPDDDADGIPDSDDECPDFAEDRDGVRDDDGCPDGRRRRRRRGRRSARVESRAASHEPARPQDWLTVALAVADSHRSLDVRVSGESNVRTHRTPPLGYLEGGLEITGYLPFAPWLGAHLSFWHSIVVGTTGCASSASFGICAAADQRDVPTTSRDLLVATTVRHRFGRTSRSATATGSIGVGQYAFTLEESATAMLDPASAVETHSYTYVAIEPGVDVP
ncbi:MAG: hypothetical protein IT379_04870, partial [Deltaproteobacteria bacterium]|nr:hypothetical protein [Deltaproteobacteria bacterium]